MSFVIRQGRRNINLCIIAHLKAANLNYLLTHNGVFVNVDDEVVGILKGTTTPISRFADCWNFELHQQFSHFQQSKLLHRVQYSFFSTV